MKDDKKIITAPIHRLPTGGMQTIHRQYGLWICAANNGISTEPDSFLHWPVRKFEFYSISHLIDGCGKVWIENGIEQEVHPGDCILIMPGTLNRYGGFGGKCFCEDFVNFTGPVADMLFQSGVISDGVFPFGKVRKLLPIIELAADPAINSQLKANIELQRLLVELHLASNAQKQCKLPLMDELLGELRRNPEKWWSIQAMAEMCRLNPCVFRQLFKERTGHNPKLYIDRLKLQKAAQMLIDSDYPIGKIAKLFGYRDQYHFSRRFKNIIGLAPEHYRKQAKGMESVETQADHCRPTGDCFDSV